MKCNKCGAEISDGIKFCTYCGAPVTSEQNKDMTTNTDNTVNNKATSNVVGQGYGNIEKPQANSEKPKKKKSHIGLIVVIAIVAILAVLAVVFMPQIKQAYHDYQYKTEMSKGNKALEASDFEKAKTAFEKADELNPNVDVNQGLADAYIGLKDNKNAAAALEKVASEKPGIDIYRQLADIYEKDGNTEKEAAVYEKIVKLTPDEETYNKLADLYIKSGNTEKAASSLEILSEISPSSEVYNKLADLYEESGDTEKEIEALEKVTSFSPELETFQRITDLYKQENDSVGLTASYLSGIEFMEDKYGSDDSLPAGGEEYYLAAIAQIMPEDSEKANALIEELQTHSISESTKKELKTYETSTANSSDIVGTWKLTGLAAYGVSMTPADAGLTEDYILILSEDGSGTLNGSAFTYSVTDGVFTIEDGFTVLTGTYVDGKVTLEESGVSMIFERQ